ncbi:potassium channel family protein [Zhihengliuella halotolerans]|uniref:Trk system potassium uptake protein TrkA n=1 Tax=Zhihengliuella halotolerans TaxID=370736 RepID=A0A4Q8A942_9MICC|nr:TrkA family potassium uptake protein [Zhihengliuella halotolerans]RZU60580.1 trk system potassium uptake protein TrkA [Zhihengliuella halotolerans]
MAKSFLSPRSDNASGKPSTVAVIGLGRFGGALALELEAAGTEVLGIDEDAERVQSFNGLLTHVVRADSTQEEALRQLAVHELGVVVVAIGSDLEASILTASRLLKFARPTIWAKAISEPHGEILDQLGVHHVVRPEHDMGRRVAHLVQGGIRDYVELDEDFVLVRTRAPQAAQDRPLDILDLDAKYNITVVAAKPLGERWQPTRAHTVLREDDEILIEGSPSATEAFSRLP